MIKKSNQTNTYCDVTNDKSENEKSQCRRLNRSSSQKDTGKWITKSKKRSEKSSNISVIENEINENIILTKPPTKIEKEIMEKVTVRIAEKEINQNPLEQIALLQVIVTKIYESILDISGQTLGTNQMINKLTDAQLLATNGFSNDLIKLATKMIELENKIKS